MFSKRTQWDLAINELMRRLEAAKESGRKVIDLTESNPTHCGFFFPGPEILSAFSNPDNLRYKPQPFGVLPARQAVAGYYREKGLTVDPQRIFLTASTSEAYSFILRLLFNPGEHLLVPRPSYPLFEFLAQLNDVDLDYYPLRYKEGWFIDMGALDALIKPTTRAIVLVNPNNPTGSFIKGDEISRINQMCREHGMAIICDEVFGDYFLEEGAGKMQSLAGNDKVLTFTLSGISKILGLPQMKLAWGVASGPQQQVTQAVERLEVILDTYLSVNTPVQNSLAHWLSFRGPIQSSIIKRIRQNWRFVAAQDLAACGCKCLQTQGGWYTVLRLPLHNNEEEWVLALLDEDNVFVHPGYFFDFEEPCIVVSLLPDPENFQKGLDRIFCRINEATS